MISFFNTVLFDPIYNGLVFLIGIMPGGDVGLAIILLTIVVKTIIFPLAHKSVKTQATMRKLEPHLKDIKKKKLDRQAEAMAVMALYKEHGVNPFSGCLLLLVQLPVILALYWVFFRGLPELDPTVLYSFVSLPETLNMHFLGVFDLAEKSAVLAVLAGISQFYQMKLSIPPAKPPEKGDGMKEEFARNMTTQMKYVMPFVIVVIAYTLSAAIALYWVTSNIYSVIHELFVKRKADKILLTHELPEKNSA